eukprot:gnl/TRDRNA2_/TRDRNA2_176398_c1_seq7.p1 gnl/TRDRNA2_/TRDRNA2_176398_c1~~gnl/TRDRNA2_/TRDRNA2_176398_c1_seq7.p1  ORF type:complete len:445 (+),score=41.97 gnl/TRDRNA2_/TRDRNA2_176398_c1_seq7:214-1548(+)
MALGGWCSPRCVTRLIGCYSLAVAILWLVHDVYTPVYLLQVDDQRSLPHTHLKKDSRMIRTVQPSANSTKARFTRNGKAAAKNLGSWKKVAAWVRANGGMVNKYLVDEAVTHGGATIRGVVSKGAISKGHMLLHIPRRLWVHLDNFPDIRDTDLGKLPPCLPQKYRGGLRIFKLSIAVAIEAQKDSASFYHPFLEYLPSMSDYQSFLPVLAAEPILSDFQGLNISKRIRHYQNVTRRDMLDCFQAWQHHSPSIPGLARLDWPRLELSYLWLKTRGARVEYDSVLMPLQDLFNTGRRELINTRYHFGVTNTSQKKARKRPAKKNNTKADYFHFEARRAIRPGGELYEQYCLCENEAWLFRYGIYLEDNPVRLSAENAIDDCSSGALRTLVKSALDVSPKVSDPSAHSQLLSPRCKAETISSTPQGPLRCSLARLAWERCSASWMR